MDERLLKQWETTERLLKAAASEIASPARQRDFSHFIDHNELELALDVLEAAAAEQAVSSEFWWNMKKAAQVMGLTDRCKRFQVRMQEC
jgi:hypothetical protein